MGVRRMAALGAAMAMLGTVLTVAAPLNAQATPTCDGKAATIVGTDGNDRIEGTDGDDVIVGLAGKDVIFGRSGNDTICGGPGNDVIKGGRGNDYVEGNQGNDKLVGGIGRDTMSGGNHKDKLFGGGGPDTLSGDSKLDFVNGEKGTDSCDLDPSDRWEACETGDVISFSGTGSATLDFDVPLSFALAKGPTRGIDPFEEFFYWFAVEFEVHSGQADLAVTMGVIDPARPAVHQPATFKTSHHESQPPVAEIRGVNRPTRATVTTFDFFPDSEWTLTFPGPDAIPYVPRTFSATGPLIGQFEVPVRAGETYEWTIDQAGWPVLAVSENSSLPSYPVNVFLEEAPAGTKYTGQLPPGTRFANWDFYGDHTFSLG